MLLGIWLPGTTCWCGVSNHQAATAQMGTRQAEFSLGINKYRRVPNPLGSTSLFSGQWNRFYNIYIYIYTHIYYVCIYIYIYIISIVIISAAQRVASCESELQHLEDEEQDDRVLRDALRSISVIISSSSNNSIITIICILSILIIGLVSLDDEEQDDCILREHVCIYIYIYTYALCCYYH